MSSYSSSSTLSPSRSLFSRSSSTDSLSTLSSEDLDRQSYQQWKGGICCEVEGHEDLAEALDKGCSVVLRGELPLCQAYPGGVDSIPAARIAMANAGHASDPLMIAMGAASSLATISLLREASDAGATHALLPLPGELLTNELNADLHMFHLGQNRFILVNYMRRILDASPLPVMLDMYAPSGLADIDRPRKRWQWRSLGG